MQKTLYQDFWNWFIINLDRIEQGVEEAKVDVIIGEIENQIKKVDPELVFEIGYSPDSGKKEFVISADGIFASVDSVKNLVYFAPKIKNWKVVAFRQPMNIPEINLEGLALKIDDIYFVEHFDFEEQKLDLDLFIKDFDETDNRFVGGVFIALDNTLGEYNVITRVGQIEFLSLKGNQDLEGLKPLIILPGVFEGYFGKESEES
jgi:hypothetical protein